MTMIETLTKAGAVAVGLVVAIMTPGCVTTSRSGVDPQTGEPVAAVTLEAAERTLIEGLKARVCEPITREFPDPFDFAAGRFELSLHVTGFRDGCARVTFTCRDGRRVERRICADELVDTGCTTPSGRGISVRVRPL